VGGGKTEASLRLIVDELLRLRKVGDSRAIVFAVPQHNLSREIAERFEALAHGTPLKAATWRGREAQAPDATGQKMCRNIELAHEAAALWADMEKEVCPTCPYYHGCRYLAQRELDGDLWIVAHQMVFHQMPGPIDNRGVYALIIDESFWRSGLFGLDDGHRLEVALDELAPFRLPIPGGNGPNSGEHLADLRDRLRHACADEPDGPINRQMLLDHGFESNSADMASRLEYRRKDKQPTWQERKENRSLRRLIALWDTIREFLASEGDEVSGRLTVVMRPGPNGTQFRAIRITGRHSILDKWRVPTLLIDANFDPDLIHFYFPRLDKITDIDVASPNMRVQQATDRAFGKSALFRGGKPNTPTLRRLRAFILREARKTDREMLVVANKAVLQELHLPSGIHTAHFNALAGRDEWRFVSKIIILGRPQPSPSSVEAIAGALTGRASITLGQNWYPRSDAYRLLAIGNDPSTAAMHYCRTDRHVDETVEKIRRQIAEGEMVQAVGRGRGVQRTEKNPLDVLILTDLVLPIPLTSVFSSREATNPDTATLMLAEGGIAYEDAAAASKAYPQLWNTPAAARQALRRQRCVTLPYRDLNGSCHRPPGTISVVYQQAGSGRHAARAFVDPQIVTDPKSVIEGVFGQLVRFEVLGDEIEAPASGLNPPETYPRLSEKASRAVALFQAHSELLVFTVAGIEPKKQNCLRQSATHLIRAWATELIEFGWEPDTVFGRPDSDRCPHGLVHFLGGEKVRAIGPEHAVTDTGRIYDRMAA
jgi:putative DNA primase/helicase